MNTKEFNEFIIKEAKKHISEGLNDILDEKKAIKKAKAPKVPKFKDTVKKTTKTEKTPEAPKAPKTIKVDECSIIEESVISPDAIKSLVIEMKDINKKIDLRNPLIDPEFFEKIVTETEQVQKTIATEEQRKRWQNIFDYEVPQDEQR